MISTITNIFKRTVDEKAVFRDTVNGTIQEIAASCKGSDDVQQKMESMKDMITYLKIVE